MADASGPQDHSYNDDRRLVDRVSYLVSLSSDAAKVDQAFNAIRSITSKWDDRSPLAEPDRTTLQRLENDLKIYLVQQDPLRDFTKESLDTRLQAHVDGIDLPHSRSWLDFQSVILFSLALATSTLLIPTTPSIMGRVILAVPVFILLTAMANARFYLSSLNNFKPELRHIFVYFCATSMGLAIQFIYFVIIPLIGQEHYPLYKYGGFTPIALGALIAMYIGLRAYAKLLKCNTPFLSWGLVTGLWCATTGLAVAAALIRGASKPGFLAFSLASLFALSAVAFCSAMVARTILKGVSPVYGASMRWLYVFTLGVFAGALFYAGVIIVLGELSGSALSAALAVCATPPMLLLLYSGYSFKKETSR